MLVQDQTSKLEITQNALTPSQANDIVSGLIDKYIGFYKVMCISAWEQNQQTCQNQFDKKVAELEEKKEELKAVLIEARKTGSEVELDSILELKLVG